MAVGNTFVLYFPQKVSRGYLFFFRLHLAPSCLYCTPVLHCTSMILAGMRCSVNQCVLLHGGSPALEGSQPGDTFREVPPNNKLRSPSSPRPTTDRTHTRCRAQSKGRQKREVAPTQEASLRKQARSGREKAKQDSKADQSKHGKKSQKVIFVCGLFQARSALSGRHQTENGVGLQEGFPLCGV